MIFRSRFRLAIVAGSFAVAGCDDTGSTNGEQQIAGSQTGTGGLLVGFGSGGVSTVGTGATAGSAGSTTSGGTGGTPASGGVPIGPGGSTGSGGSPTGTGGSAGTGGSPTGTGGSVGSGGSPIGTGGSAGTGGAPASGGADGGSTHECGVFAAVADLAKPGPFTASNAAEGVNCQIYRPTTLGQGGVRHPVILWANGTGGPTFVYGAAFDYWVSHGFIVAAGNSSNGQGSGAEMLACLDYLTTQNGAAGSPYQGKVCVTRVGASGHSQGGGGALMAGRDARLTATAPLMPYIAQGFGGFDTASITAQHGPMLLLSGTADTIAPPDTNQKPVFDTTNVPVFWANLVGGDHVAVSLNGLDTYRNVMLAWYRLVLMGDESFRSMFYGPSCTLCADAAWKVQRKGIN